MKKILLCLVAALTMSTAMGSPHLKTKDLSFLRGMNAEIGRTNINIEKIAKQSLERNRNRNGVKRAPSRVAENTPFYGFLYFSNSLSDLYGLYEYIDDDFYFLWEDPVTKETYFTPECGWYVDGKVCGVSTFMWFGLVAAYYSYSIDFETGELLNCTQYDHYAFDVMFFQCKLNTDDNMIYGYAIDLDKQAVYWSRSNPDTPDQVEELAPAYNLCMALCYNEAEQCFYGISDDWNFMRIDLDGTHTPVAKVPDIINCDPDYVSGLMWDPNDNIFYWNLNRLDYSSALYTITPDGEFDLVMDLPNEWEFSFFFTTETYVNPNAPLPAELEKVNFEGPALTGTLSYFIPKKFGDGQPLPNSINYILLIDGKEYSKGSVKPGEKLEAKYSVPEDGMYTLTIMLEYNGEKSRPTNTRLFIGNDTPLSPTNITLTNTMISWENVTEGVNHGYVNIEGMEYEIRLNGELIATTNNTNYPIDLKNEGELTYYVAEISAISNGKIGQAGKSNKIVVGSPLDPPLFYRPTREEFNLMTIYDANNDGMTWYLGDNGYLYSGFTNDENVKMKDYIFLPPMKLSKDERYFLGYNIGLVNWDYMREYCSVVLASEPNDKSIIKNILGSNQPFESPNEDNDWKNWDNVETLFSVNESGTYYIGFYSSSNGNGLGMLLKDILVTSGSAPGRPSITSQKGDKGALHATINVTLPQTSLDGKTYDENTILTGTFKVNGVLVENTIEGKPGTTVSTVLETIQGDNDIELVLYNGKMRGPSTEFTVFTGVNIPAAPRSVSLTVNPDMISGTLRWSAVTTPANPDGYVNPELITYDIWTYNSNNPKWEVYKTGITGTEYSIQMDGWQQAQYGWGVSAHNAAGSGEYVGDYGMMGEPYKIPFRDNFCDTGSELTPWFRWPINNQYGVTLIYYQIGWVYNAFEGDTDIVIVGESTGIRIPGLLSMPRFSTIGLKDATLTFNCLRGENSAAFGLYANLYNDNRNIQIGSVPAISGEENTLRDYTFTLPQVLLNKEWVQVYIEIEFPNEQARFILNSVEGTEGPIAGVETLSNNSLIRGGHNEILFTNYENERVMIFSIDGKIVKDTLLKTDEETIKVEKGIYIVKVADRSEKIVVR